ncbi:histidine phosphatase family protein [Parasphingorhabdus cellanae]|uniref:Histidine phosphatase family protein n=1 Tax=Parasphingorhabdus cellanae TaxID=2806553 RepID=A0ABX7T8J3_9SPHN|nr:histidine phosphatase family protein [Parasphingorhabdus cellanae]QTD56759.1 histidine phosphatase family protein [Parasphingorhabdus cellanae]
MIWLVRHPPVAIHWQKLCYGASDMGLSREGARIAKVLVDKLVTLSPDLIVHSDRKRTRIIAEQAAEKLSAEIRADHRWRERDFGDWEGCSWNEIYRATGNAMDGMLDDPEGFRPGGGETTQELVDRALDGWRTLLTDKDIAVIAHGGPIAAVLAHRAEASISSLPDYIPQTGSITEAG